MKRFLLIFGFTLISLNSLISQGISGFTLCGEYSENFSRSNYSGGINIDVKVSDKLALSYKALIGGSTGKALYVHAPDGAAAGSVLLKAFSNTNSKFINGLGILLFIIPEGITFYPNPAQKIKTGIYLAPLGCDYWYKKSNYEYFRFSGEAGGKLKIPLNDKEQVYLQLNAGLRYLYRNKTIDPFFITAGGGLFFSFK